MSIIFVPPDQRTSETLSTTEIVKKMLEENAQLIQTIFEYQLKGKMAECVEYQKLLHRNVVYLKKLVDLGSSGQVSLAAQGSQTGSISGSHVIQTHSSGQGGSLNAVSSQGCQQGNLQIPGPSTTVHQSLMSHQPLMPVEHSSNFVQMSHSCIGQSSNLLMPQQQLVLSQDQSVLLHHPTTLAGDSYSLTSLHDSNQIMVVQPLSHQDGYHSLTTGQQEYTPQQQFAGYLVEIPQYTQLMPASSLRQNQQMSDQQIQESSQNYVSYNRQRITDSPGVDQQQQSNMDGAENQTARIG